LLNFNGKLHFQKTLVLALQHGRIQAECMFANGGLLKVREREIQREHGGMQVGSVGALKTCTNPWEGQTLEIPT
jgi:hypothetical protein